MILLFPHQLFWPNNLLNKDEEIVLIEESLFFTQYKFHKQKLIFHRASMKAYAENLKNEAYKIKYIEFNQNYPKAQEISCIEVHDDWLKQKIEKTYPKVNWIKSPNFLTQTALKKLKKYRMSSFYIQQRKDLNLLLDGEGKVIGGKWSFDEANRQKIPKGLELPKIKNHHSTEKLKHIEEAKKYIEKHFPNNYGNIENFIYPITHNDAEAWLQDFLKQRFKDFGAYEDAMQKGESYLFHSILSPLLNVGLLDPMQVVNAAMEHAKNNKIPLNSLEGFIRQIIGWREFVNQLYHLEGKQQRTKNFFKHKRPISKSFWNGTTGIEPIDDVIQKLNKTAYSHHIERLMIISNFMNLCEFDPDEIYEWFMSFYIDAYDWVMVPNVYGMSLYADGGLMTTKPYISSSNYVRKMSNYKKGEWCEIWDALYWRFIHKHQDFFAGNPRLSVMTLALKRMKEEKLQQHLRTAEAFLKNLN